MAQLKENIANLATSRDGTSLFVATKLAATSFKRPARILIMDSENYFLYGFIYEIIWKNGSVRNKESLQMKIAGLVYTPYIDSLNGILISTMKRLNMKKISILFQPEHGLLALISCSAAHILTSMYICTVTPMHILIIYTK